MASLSAKLTSKAPANLTSFVGRRNDLVSVRQLFSATRLVTLTGIGGVGKTRLALQVASELSRAFPDGVYLVELAALNDADLLPHTLMEALEIRERPSAKPIDVLAEFLQDRRLLLILDNCEHLVEATADLLDSVLRAGPDISVLVTSRQAIRIAGEHVYPVAPLLVPDPSDNLEPGTALHYPSVALFVDRASAVVPGFSVTRENEAAVVRLCHRLEGIPLAIELASVRLRVLTVHDLADRLDDRFQLLREGNRNVPDRHRTLSALVDWSYDLCTPTEQLLWTRSSVFAGGFGGDAVEEVCTDEQLPRSAVLDTLAGLVDKSILIRDEQAHHVRFRMLDTISAYGRVRLAERGEDAALARRHRDFYAALIARAGQEWAGPQQEEWAIRLRLEHANIRHALEFCMSTPGEARTGLAMAAVPWFWGAMDHMDEAQLWLERGLALETTASHQRAWGLATSAYMAAFQGHEQLLSTLPEQARDLAIELDDLPALAFANHVRGFRQSLGATSGLGDAVPMLTEALAQYEEADVDAQYADSLRVELAATHLMLGQLDDAARVVDELYERCHTSGERWNFSYALWLRGLLSLMRGDTTAAEDDLFEAIRIKRPFRDTLGWALTLEVIAWAAAAKGEAERAATLLGATDTLWRMIGARQLRGLRARYESQALDSLGAAKFEAAHARGAKLSVDEVLAFGLREPLRPAETKPHGGPAKLSPRELQVARLVADGLSNKEIAAKLVISLRTAEGHVENILTKQGFKTRTQIASWVVQQEASKA